MTYHPSPATISLRHLVTLIGNSASTTCFAWRFRPQVLEPDILRHLRQTVMLLRVGNFGMRLHTESTYRLLLVTFITRRSRKCEHINAFRYRVYLEFPPRKWGNHPHQPVKSSDSATWGKMVIPTGFEPVTCPLGGGCSIQLSHGTTALFMSKNRVRFKRSLTRIRHKKLWESIGGVFLAHHSPELCPLCRQSRCRRKRNSRMTSTVSVNISGKFALGQDVALAVTIKKQFAI